MSMSNPNNRNYDPNIIIKAANEKLAINNDVAGDSRFDDGVTVSPIPCRIIIVIKVVTVTRATRNTRITRATRTITRNN